MEILIQGDHAKILIDVQSWAHPDSSDYNDGNWLAANIQIGLQGFSANFPLLLRAEEFIAFKNSLTRMASTFSGASQFETMENGIFLNAQIQKNGRIVWEGKAIYPEGDGATLQFAFENDQSYLAGLISQLDSVIKAFPTKEKPN